MAVRGSKVSDGGDGTHDVRGGHNVKKKTTVHSRCVQVHVKDVLENAVSILSSKSEAGEIPLVLIPEARSTLSMMLPIPTGVHCLMQRFGKDVGCFKPGLHILPAWYRIAYIVSQQKCCYDAPVLSCPTADDVRVSVDVVLIFGISDPVKFIYRLGAKNFDEFLSGTVDEAIRQLVRKETSKTVYALRGDSGAEMLEKLNQKFMESGVTFYDVKVTDVKLPEQLANALEITTKMSKGMEKLVTANEFEMLQIRLDSEMQIEEIRRGQEKVLVSEAGRKRQAEMQFEQRCVKAEEDGRVALIAANGKVEVNRYTCQSNLDRTKMRLETFRVNMLSQAQVNASSMMIQADKDEETAIIGASWQEEKMLAEAEITRIEADLEGEAIKLLAAKRDHDMLLQEKEILKKLAISKSFNLIGTPADRLVDAMLNGTFAQAKAGTS